MVGEGGLELFDCPLVWPGPGRTGPDAWADGEDEGLDEGVEPVGVDGSLLCDADVEGPDPSEVKFVDLPLAPKPDTFE